MPYGVRKRNCKQADGKKGKYVVVKKKSKGRTEQESCHTSKKKAKGAVRARYASEANEGETVKITLEELKQLISEAMAEVTRPFPVYEKEEDLGERDEVEEYGFGASDDPMRELSDEARGEIEEAIETTVDPDVVKSYLDSEGGAAGPEDTVAAVRDASDTDDDQALTDDEILAKVKDIEGVEQSSAGDLVDTATLTEAVMVALQPMIKPAHQEMTQDDFWMKVAGIKAESLNEGEVVDMFSADEAKQNAVKRIADALAIRAEAMLDEKAGRVESALDLDGSSNFIDVEIDVDVDPALSERFLEPYPDIDGHGGLVPALAVSIYEDYVSGKAGDQAESLDSIIERISIDYFDEDIEYALEALGDDRFTMPHTYHDDDQMMKTKEMAARQDPDDIDAMEAEIEARMQGRLVDLFGDED